MGFPPFLLFLLAIVPLFFLLDLILAKRTPIKIDISTTELDYRSGDIVTGLVVVTAKRKVTIQSVDIALVCLPSQEMTLPGDVQELYRDQRTVVVEEQLARGALSRVDFALRVPGMASQYTAALGDADWKTSLVPARTNRMQRQAENGEWRLLVSVNTGALELVAQRRLYVEMTAG